jgi:hypothetical protein
MEANLQTTTEKTYSNPETSKTIHNWPFGRDRATALFYVEVDPKRGQRAVRETIDPLTGKRFSPKKLTYAKRVRFVDGSDGKTYILEDNMSHFTIMQGTMKYQEEAIFPDSPRYAKTVALFEVEECK